MEPHMKWSKSCIDDPPHFLPLELPIEMAPHSVGASDRHFAGSAVVLCACLGLVSSRGSIRRFRDGRPDGFILHAILLGPDCLPTKAKTILTTFVEELSAQ